MGMKLALTHRHRQIYACKRLEGIALSASQFIFFTGGW